MTAKEGKIKKLKELKAGYDEVEAKMLNHRFTPSEFQEIYKEQEIILQLILNEIELL